MANVWNDYQKSSRKELVVNISDPTKTMKTKNFSESDNLCNPKLEPRRYVKVQCDIPPKNWEVLSWIAFHLPGPCVKRFSRTLLPTQKYCHNPFCCYASPGATLNIKWLLALIQKTHIYFLGRRKCMSQGHISQDQLMPLNAAQYSM